MRQNQERLTSRFFDAHAHTQFAAFDQDREEVIGRALRVVIGMINVGTQRDTSRRAVELAGNYRQGVYASVGLHPIHSERLYHYPEEWGFSSGSASTGPGGESVPVTRRFRGRGEEFDYDYYRQLANDPKVVSVGECGLDYYSLSNETKRKQKNAFEQQIHLAHEVDKPLMIHCRNAFDDLLEILNSNSRLLGARSAGIVHFFTGTKQHAKALADLGFSFTFGGIITLLDDYTEVIRTIPLDGILSETDAPYLAPAPYRDSRNEPAYIIEVVKELACIKKMSLDRMAETIWENTKRVFNLRIMPEGVP